MTDERKKSDTQDADKCIECGSREIVNGKFNTPEIVLWGDIDLLFNVRANLEPSHSATASKLGRFFNFREYGPIIIMKLASSSKCCLKCGLVWTKAGFSGDWHFKNGDGTNCANCESERIATGKIVMRHETKENPVPITFNPGINFMFRYSNPPVVEDTSLLCADCQYVFSKLDPKALMRFILRHCKPDYVKNILSYIERQSA